MAKGKGEKTALAEVGQVEEEQNIREFGQGEQSGRSLLNEPADIAQAGQGDNEGIGIAAKPPQPIQAEPN